MIHSPKQFFSILREGKEIEKYTVPNGTVTLEIHSFVDKKLLEEEIYQHKFKQLYESLHNLLRNTINLLESKYGSLPAELEPARQLFCLFVSRKTCHTFAMWATGPQMGLIVPLYYLHEHPENIRSMLIHECLHNCARLHHKEGYAIREIEAHQKEIRAIINMSQKETLDILRGLAGLDNAALNKFIEGEVNLFAHYFFANFYNIITDLGINIIVSLLNIRNYINTDLKILQNNIGNLNTTISYLEQNKHRIGTRELYRIEFSLLVFGMPWSILPFIYNRYYSAQATNLIRRYFDVVRKTSPEVQERIRKIYADFLRIIRPHKVDLYGFNFNLKKIIHTEESVGAAKVLHKDIISFLKF